MLVEEGTFLDLVTSLPSLDLICMFITQTLQHQLMPFIIIRYLLKHATHSVFIIRDVHSPADSYTYCISFMNSCHELIHVDEFGMMYNSGSDAFCKFVSIKILYM